MTDDEETERGECDDDNRPHDAAGRGLGIP